MNHIDSTRSPRKRSLDDLAAMSPLDVARLFDRGETLTDDEIDRLPFTARIVAIDPGMRSKLLRSDDPGRSKQSAPIILRTTPEEGVVLSDRLDKIARLLAAPTVPVYDTAGMIVGAKRDLPKEPLAAAPVRTAPPGPRSDPTHEPRKPKEGSVTFRMLERVLADTLLPHLRDLSKRIAALETNTPQASAGLGFIYYRGQYDAKETYEAGEYISHDNHVWRALEPCRGVQPGAISSVACWQLIMEGETP